MPTGENHGCPTARRPIPYVAVIFDKYGARVLVEVQESKFAFPRVACPEIPHRGRLMSECFSRAIHDLVGVSYNLNFLYSGVNEVYRRDLVGTWRAMFECDSPIQPGSRVELLKPLSTSYQWVALSKIQKDLQDDVLDSRSDLDFRAFYNAFRIDVDTSEDGVRPWEVTRWYAGVVEDARLALENLGYQLTSPFEQYQISSTAAVLRASTSKGRVYLKASTKREGAVLQCVSSFAPHLVRAPLHVNAKDAWILMDDYGDTLDRKFTRRDFKCILELHGKLQVESMKHIPELLNAGLALHGTDMLWRRLQVMLEDEEIGELLEGCEEFECEKKDNKVDLTTYRAACDDFLRWIYDEGKAPQALVHGDLIDINMVRVQGKDGEYIVYDWGSARIDVPFSDVISLESEVVDGDKSNKIGIDSYLEQWSDYGTVSELREVCRFVNTKDRLLRVVEVFECSKKKRVKPCLKVAQTNYLGRALGTVRERMYSGKWPECKGPLRWVLD